MFDQDLYVEHDDQRFGPYKPSGGPIPLHRYRKAAKSRLDERPDRVAVFVDRLGLPRATMDGGGAALRLSALQPGVVPDHRPFAGPDPFQQLAYPTMLVAKHAIADEFGPKQTFGGLRGPDRIRAPGVQACLIGQQARKAAAAPLLVLQRRCQPFQSLRNPIQGLCCRH